MKLQNNTKIYLSMLMLSLIVLFSGCKKNYVDYPYSDLLSFSLKDANGEALKAVVSNNDITIYWPPYQAVPDSISPVIVVAERATVSPASGTKVPFKESTKFTVTAQDGTKKVYTLKQTINQPIPYISMINTNSYDFEGLRVFQAEEYFDISGDYFVPDTVATKVYLDIEGGKEIALPMEYADKTRVIAGDISAYVPKGTYFKFRVVSGSRTITSGRCVIGEKLPMLGDINYLYMKPYQPGETFKIEGSTNISTLTSISASFSAGGTFQEFVIASNTEKEIIVKIPDNMPVGTYYVFKYTYGKGTFHAAKTTTVYSTMKVVAK